MLAGRRGITADVAPADERVCADRDDHGIAARHPFFDVTPRLVERRRFESGKKSAFARYGVKRAAKGSDVTEPDRCNFKADAIGIHAARLAESQRNEPCRQRQDRLRSNLNCFNDTAAR